MAVQILSITAVLVISFVVIRKIRERQWGKCRSKKTMTDKVVIVTGANSGLGKATAEEFARRGACVIMACRDMQKAQEALEDIRKRTENGILKILELDLSCFHSVKRFVENFLSSENRLDVLINNAGIYQCPFMLSRDGYEMQFGVNYLGHFLLTKLLLETLKQSSPSRIINVSSSLYKKGHLNINELTSNRNYDKSKAYSNSKLANLLFTRELSRKLKYTGVTSYALSPGIVWTNLSRYAPLPYWKIALLAPIGLFFVRTPQQGIQTILHCALSEDLEEETGLYYSNCQACEVVGFGKDDNLARKLWEYSEDCIAKTLLHEKSL